MKQERSRFETLYAVIGNTRRWYARVRLQLVFVHTSALDMAFGIAQMALVVTEFTSTVIDCGIQIALLRVLLHQMHVQAKFVNGKWPGYFSPGKAAVHLNVE